MVASPKGKLREKRGNLQCKREPVTKG